ncbi:MAG: hypothetical protein ACRCT7_15340 [Shewanella sp.]
MSKVQDKPYRYPAVPAPLFSTRMLVVHFVLTIITLGLWGLVWWILVLKAEGRQFHLFSAFDEAYWQHLILREQPPSSLHPQQFDANSAKSEFSA